MKAHFEMMAAYNAWANARLVGACLALPEEDYRADCQVAFTSLHGTLNHVYVADVIWLARFRAESAPAWPLDKIVHDNRTDFAARRKRLDTDIIGFTGVQSPETLATPFTYRTKTTNAQVTQVLGHALAHFFNHQTHHRGQCHAMLTRLAGAAPPLDLLYFQREAG